MTASPLDNWSNTAPMSDVPLREEETPLVGIGGGGTVSNFGRGGGGGGPEVEEAEGVGGPALDMVCPDCTSRRASWGSIPSLLFHVTPEG